MSSVTMLEGASGTTRLWPIPPLLAFAIATLMLCQLVLTAAMLVTVLRVQPRPRR